MVAWAIGGPAAGWLSDRIGRRKGLYMAGTATALLGWIAIIFAHEISTFSMLALLILTGASSGVMVISFAFAKESVPAYLTGTITGVINTGVMIGPMLLQPAVSLVLDARWEGKIEGSVRVYGEEAFQAGFSLMLVWLLLSLILLAFTQETFCRQRL
jgi:MFS family permease